MKKGLAFRNQKERARLTEKERKSKKGRYERRVGFSFGLEKTEACPRFLLFVLLRRLKRRKKQDNPVCRDILLGIIHFNVS